jgi:hypothetical protein
MLAREDLKCNFREFSYTHTKVHQEAPRSLLDAHRRCTRAWLHRSGRTGSTSTSPCAATTRLRPHALYVDLAVRREYSSPSARALRRPRRAPRILVSGCTRSMSTSPCAATTRLRPHALYVDLAVHRDYSSPAAHALHRLRQAPQLLVSGRTRSTPTSPCAATTRLRPHALYVNLVVRREYSSSLSRLQRSTSPTPRIPVPRHVARLVTRLVAPLVVDYFAYVTRPGASARRAPITRLIIGYSVCRDFVLRPRWLYFSHAVRGDYLSRGNTGSTSSTPRAATTSSSGQIALTIHLD